MYLVLCTKPKDVVSMGLRLAMGSEWSHSAIYDNDAGLVYDVTFKTGVRKQRTSYFFTEYKHCLLIPIDVPPEKMEEARQWLEDQLKKKYDFSAIVAIGIRRDWQEEDKWFCSEMTETFRTKFEKVRFNAKASRITPQLQAIVK